MKIERITKSTHLQIIKSYHLDAYQIDASQAQQKKGLRLKLAFLFGTCEASKIKALKFYIFSKPQID